MAINLLFYLQCVEDKISMLEIHTGGLNTQEIYARWEKIAIDNNCGAFCFFNGIVRDENGIQGLSFDIYEPLLKEWFEKWRLKAESLGVIILMAHSIGDVKNSQSSYMCAIISSQRKAALGIYEDFIQDFKAKAPIWKYDLKDGKRIYAKDRSSPLPYSGILT